MSGSLCLSSFPSPFLFGSVDVPLDSFYDLWKLVRKNQKRIPTLGKLPCPLTKMPLSIGNSESRGIGDKILLQIWSFMTKRNKLRLLWDCKILFSQIFEESLHIYEDVKKSITFQASTFNISTFKL